MPRSAADILADEATVHAFTLLRVQAGMRRDALAVLESLEKELGSQADKFAGTRSAQSQVFANLEAQTGKIIASAYKVIAAGQADDLERIAVSEKVFANRAMNGIVGAEVFTKAINPKVLEAVSGPVVLGHSSADWWNGQSVDLRRKFGAEMAKGILLGEDNDALRRRVMGTKKNGYADGIMQVSKRDATALVRTSAQSVSNYARIESFKQLGTAKGIEWLATLDSRTTPICIALDKKQWRFPDLEPIGHNKRFPGYTAHWNCRSTVTAVTYTWAELANRKLPDLNNQKLQEAVEEKLKDAGMDEDKIGKVIVNARASMDGQTSAVKNFEQWAETKSPEFVEKVIGPGRFELWNSGQISFNDLTNQDNRPLTMAALEKAVESGELPSETLGVAFHPPPRSLTSPEVLRSVQEATDNARKDEQEKAAARIATAERQAKAAEAELEKLTQAQAEQLVEYAAKLAEMGEKYAAGEDFTAEEEKILDSLPSSARAKLLGQWQALREKKKS